MKKIEYYYKNSDVIAYQKIIYDSGYWKERTYDEKGNELSYKDSYGDYKIKGRKVHRIVINRINQVTNGLRITEVVY